MAKIVGIDLGTTNSKDKKLFMRRFVLGSKFNSHNIGNDNQSPSNPEQGCTNLSAIEYMIKLVGIHCENWSNAIASTMLTIADTNDLVKVSKSRLTKPGAISTNPIQPAERLPLIPESTLKNDFLTAFTLAKRGTFYNNSNPAQVVVGRSAFAKATADKEESTN